MRNPEKEGELATLPGSRCRLWTSPTRRDRSCHSGPIWTRTPRIARASNVEVEPLLLFELVYG